MDETEPVLEPVVPVAVPAVPEPPDIPVLPDTPPAAPADELPLVAVSGVDVPLPAVLGGGTGAGAGAAEGAGAGAGDDFGAAGFSPHAATPTASKAANMSERFMCVPLRENRDVPALLQPASRGLYQSPMVVALTAGADSAQISSNLFRSSRTAATSPTLTTLRAEP